MPIYEYQCEACGGLSEVFQKVSDPAPDVCPSCNKPQALTKVVSRTSFQLKGGGWYADLYSSTPKSASAGSRPESGGSTASPSAASTPAPAAGGTTGGSAS